MATDLYETLGVSKDATPEEIRKAYKKNALKTHPDRLSPNATPAEKAASEEQFRRVNNAYEVLNDPQNRRVYDLHGVWPPQEPEYEEAPRRSGPSRPRDYTSHYHYRPPRSPFGDPFEIFDDPFFRNPGAFTNFIFTDPFRLFDSVFSDDFHRVHHHRGHRARRYEPEDPYDRARRMHNEMAGFISDMERSMFGMFNSGFGRAQFPMLADSPTFSNGNGMHWAAESHMMSNLNGVSQSVHKRRDWDGNKHEVRILPDGRKIHTINGVEQPSNNSQSIPYHSENRGYLPTPPVGHAHSSGPTHYGAPPPPYPGHTNNYNSTPHEYERRHHRSHSDSRKVTGPVIPDRYNDTGNNYDVPEDNRERKRWWHSGW